MNSEFPPFPDFPKPLPLPAKIAVGAFVALMFAGGLAGCTNGQPDAALIAAGVRTGLTLAQTLAPGNKTVAQVVNGGVLFCKDAGGTAAIFGAASAPTSVIGQTSQVVAATCGALSPTAVPVAPPAVPGAVPVVVAATALPAQKP